MSAKHVAFVPDAVFENALATYEWHSVTPGGVVAAGDAQQASVFAFGSATPDGPAIEKDSVYDLASVTKPIAGAMLTARLISAGKLSLSTCVGDICPGETKIPHVTIAQLLGHASGLPAHIKFYLKPTMQQSDDPRATITRLVAETEPVRAAGEVVEYSDLGYIMLGHLLSIVGGAPLETQVVSMCRDLGMTNTRYADNAKGERIDEAVPTQQYPERGWAQGTVHDENAFSGGGVFAHAGLFAPMQDVVVFAQSMLRLMRGHAVGAISPAVIQEMTQSAAGPGTWRLGWDTPAPLPEVSNAGTRWRDNVIGHLGYTGTCVWLNLTSGQFISLLTNRVQFSREKPPIRNLRIHLMDSLADHLAQIAR